MLKLFTKISNLFYKPIYISLLGNKKIDVLNLQDEDISIYDIAISLSKICRFNGHSNEFYSVAEHSILCYELAKNDNVETDGLKAVFAHDFSEAYCGDVITPIKSYLGKKFSRIEDRISKSIAKKYNIDFYKYEKVIKYYDKKSLDLEFSTYKYANLSYDSLTSTFFEIEKFLNIYYELFENEKKSTYNLSSK